MSSGLRFLSVFCVLSVFCGNRPAPPVASFSPKLPNKTRVCLSDSITKHSQTSDNYAIPLREIFVTLRAHF